jgi:ADP-ribose pyrophosphatase
MAHLEDAGGKRRAREMGWDVQTTDYPFTSPWLTLRRDQVSTGESDFTYTYMQAAPAVFIVPVTATGDVILIRQYRYTVDEWCLEVPAGGTGDREGASLEDVAREELREEIGGVSDDIRQVTTFFPSVSRTDQIAHVFAAFDVRLETGQQLEGTERIELLPTPAREALAMARRGEIRDGQSALCLILCEGLIREMGFVG